MNIALIAHDAKKELLSFALLIAELSVDTMFVQQARLVSLLRKQQVLI